MSQVSSSTKDVAADRQAGDEVAEPSTSGRSASEDSRKSGMEAPVEGWKAHQLAPSKETQLHALFDAYDTDHDGSLEASDLKVALQAYGLPISQPYLQALMRQYDKDGDKAISFEEFKLYVQSKDKAVAKAFAKLDVDKSGSISVDELVQGLKRQWLPLEHSDAERMVHLLDKDHNNEISYQEFRRYCFLLPSEVVEHDEILQSWVDSTAWTDQLEYHVANVPPRQGFNRFLAGGLAGGVSRTAVAPFERLKIMMMADTANSSFVGTAKKMWKDGGTAGLFRGNLSTVLKVLPQSATQFAVYDTLQDMMVRKVEESGVVAASSSDLTKAQHLIAGGLAGAAATLVTYPLETVRTHMAMGSPSMTKVASELYRSHGMSGCYRGLHASLVANVVSSSLGFTAYEMAISKYRKVHHVDIPTPAERGACAGVAAVAVMTVVMPLENITRRLQVQGREARPVLYGGTWDCARRIYAAEGVRAFWRGSLSSYLKVAPSIAAVRFIYEALMQSSVGGGGVQRYREPAEQPDPPDPIHPPAGS